MQQASPETVARNKQAVSHWINLVNARAFERLSEDWSQDVTVNQGRDVSETIGLDDVEEAFHRMERGEVLRSVVVLG